MQTDEILSKLRERIVAYAAFHLSRDLAEDVAQEVMLLLHTKYGNVSAADDLVPLAIEIARLKIAGIRRKIHRRGEDRRTAVEEVPLADPGPSPSAYVERKESLERLAAALAGLRGRCRELFRLKLQGKNFAEIREALGAASINTVYTWDFRCRKELLAKLEGRWEAEP
ncbi:MAG: RNA polymerase sigma factor [Bryobacterales bacterium]|nr:RNA polymerase sigma factor [Bryobacterales bacterium]